MKDPDQMQDFSGRQMQIVRNAKQNCIAMFIIMLFWMVVIIAMSGDLDPRKGRPGCIGMAAVLFGVYAAIYLPLRWRIIRQLPPLLGVLGLIGGLGLIGVAAWGLVMIYAGAAVLPNP